LRVSDAVYLETIDFDFVRTAISGWLLVAIVFDFDWQRDFPEPSFLKVVDYISSKTLFDVISALSF
jgi:hypothetical protein